MTGEIIPDENFAKDNVKSVYQIMGMAMGKDAYHEFLNIMHDVVNELMIIEAMPTITVHEKQVRSLEVDSFPDVMEGDWNFPSFDEVIIYDAEPATIGDTPSTRRESTISRKNSVRKKHPRSGDAK